MSCISILYVIDGLEYGGGERTFLHLVRGLPKDRFSVHIATNPDGILATQLRAIGVPMIPLRLHQQINYSNVKRLRRMLSDHRIDIVHSMGGRADFYARLAVRSLSGVRLINTIAMVVEGYNVSILRKIIYRCLDRWSERYVSHFITDSSHGKKALIRAHSIAPCKVTCIHGGVEMYTHDPEHVTALRAKLRHDLKISEKAFLIGALGRLVWQKGFEYLLKGATQICKDFPHAILIIVGDGPLKPELQQLVHDQSLDGRIIFSGFRQDLYGILAAIDILVIPSLAEGFPMITLEGMAMQKPIVASRIPGIAEQITDSEHGLLVPPRNPRALAMAISALMRDVELARTLASHARRKAEREFSIDAMVKSTMHVYHKQMQA